MSKPTFRKFDYRVRPAKGTERKMLCEAFRRLSFFEPVERYRYIGFGAVAFVDFALFHKALGITDMISIEERESYKARFKFNKPFDCIKMKYGHSSAVLPKLDWDKRAIIWLDYDRSLTDSVLRDVAYVVTSAISGSMLVVTVNAHPVQLPDPRPGSEEEVEEYRLQMLEANVGSDKVPRDIRGKNLEGWEMARTYRHLIIGEIEQSLRDRNGLRSAEDKMRYQQLFNFHYRDGAKMLTVGGVFYKKKDKPTLEKCEFTNLDFVRLGEEPYDIKVPVLTPLERRYLDKRLPEGKVGEATEKIGLAESDVDNYEGLYRYSPAFAEVELT